MERDQDYEKLTDGINSLNISLARMEGKIDNALELKTKVELLDDKLDITDDLARQAIRMAEQNKEDVNELKKNMQWSVTAILSILVPLALFVLQKTLG